MAASEFMLHLVRQLVEERKVLEATASAYVKTLFQLNDKKPFKNLTFLKDTAAVEKHIAPYAESTQRGIYIAIASSLSLVKDKPTYKKLFEYYEAKMLKETEKRNEQLATGQKTPKQKENWLTWNAVEEKKAELKAALPKKSKTITEADYDKVLQYFILSLYTDIQPRRNQDYLDMYIVKKYDSTTCPPEMNYYDLTTNSFILNKYKTAKKYGQQTIYLPPPLKEVMATFLTFHPLWKGAAKRSKAPVKLLVNHAGEPLNAVNSITRILNRIFKKAVGSSMLRHIYLTDKYADTVDSMAADSTAMAHSSSVQKQYIKKSEPKNEIIYPNQTPESPAAP